MNKRKGCLPGCLGAFWAAFVLACGGLLANNGPSTNRNYLASDDVILIYARSGPENGRELTLFAVKRGDTKPTPWASEETDDLAAVTAVSHTYMGDRLFPYNPYEDKTPFYYGVNGRHVPVSRPDAPPIPDLRPPEPENSRLEVIALRWSPDGRYLAYVVRDRNRPPARIEPSRLYLLDAATEESQLLREDGFRAEAVRWSEDGRYLFATVGVRLERWDSREDSWLDLDWNSDYVDGSADGQHLLWHDSARKMYSLSDASGENRYPLLEEGSVLTAHYAWSPDGRYLAFQSADAGYGHIHVADLQRRTVREIYKVLTTSHAASGFTMTWSPDSSQIAFLGLGRCVTTLSLAKIAETSCNRDVYVVPLDGGAAQRVTNTNNGAISIDNGYTIGWLKE